MKTVAIAAAAEFALNGLLKYAESMERIRQQQAEGRTHLTIDEWEQLVAETNAARSAAQEAVDRAIAEGR